MVDVDRCPECGIPMQTVDSQQWLNNGVIVHKGDQSVRVAYAECEALDPLFDGIGQLIGVPVERIIVDAQRKSSRDFFNPMFTEENRDMIRSGEVSLGLLTDAMTLTARIHGCGRLEVKDINYESKESDFVTLISGDSYAVLLTMGDIAGACEAATGYEFSDFTYRKISPGTYEMTARLSGFSLDQEGGLERKEYSLREGSLEFERCPTCGAPKEFMNYKWDIDLGTIRNSQTGRRLALIWPSAMDLIFAEMGKELGDIVPRVIIEAQRRLSRTGFHSVEELKDEKHFRDQLILRGMGNLREFKMDPKGLYLRLDNACMHLMVLGMIQGLFEIAFDKESSVQWELSEEGDLKAEVSPLFSQFLCESNP